MHLQYYSIIIVVVCSSKNKPPQGFSFRPGFSFLTVNSLRQFMIFLFVSSMGDFIRRLRSFLFKTSVSV